MTILNKNILVFKAYVLDQSFASARYNSLLFSEGFFQNRLQFILGFFQFLSFSINNTIFGTTRQAIFAASNCILWFFSINQSVNASSWLYHSRNSFSKSSQIININNIFQNTIKPKL